ncbi:MAG: DNA primase catalytic subunit PriS [Methanomicrobiales archaeon]|nr:DNA primase catalytic subunit PriS [Methanomicrobiales archaeon]
MKPATLEFIKQRFTEYYREGHLIAPPSVSEREWGFMYFESQAAAISMHRHMAFSAKRELFDYIRNVVPAHIYYSSAYYAEPAAPTMGEKRWYGADLIFDLDADHIMKGPYHLMLSKVKEETEKLLEMLTEELGFEKRAIRVVFSGGRGYHIHVTDISIRSWGSRERREIVDYVRGIGIEPRTIFSRDAQECAGGWRSRLQDVMEEYLAWLKERSANEALEHLTSIGGIGAAIANDVIKGIEDMIGELHRGDVPLLLRRRGVKTILSEKNPEFRRRLEECSARADEPVTTDTKRLIRMPTSLHGGSGLRVTPLAVRDLPAFDPLIDAVVFGRREVEVEPALTTSTRFLDNDYRVEKGVTERIPEALAVFLCCRGLAEIAGGRSIAAG